jgi:hypothetical protein
MEDITMADISSSEVSKTIGFKCPRCGTCTHPYSVDHGHKSSFETFLDDVNSGLKRSIEAKMAYLEVRVLFIRWERDTLIAEGHDIGVQGEIDALERVSRECSRNFNVTKYRAPSDFSVQQPQQEREGCPSLLSKI